MTAIYTAKELKWLERLEADRKKEAEANKPAKK